MNPPRAPLERAVEMSLQMLAAARAGDWDMLAVLEADREPLVMRQHPPGEASLAAIAQILALDGEIAVMVARARDAAAADWQRVHEGRRAIAAYRG